jgi:hypothetical protein
MEPLDLTEVMITEAAPVRSTSGKYRGSVMEHSSVAEEYRNSPDKLFNDRDPQLVVMREQPEHRIAIMMAAAGMPRKEIAARLGYTYVYIGQLLRQPWARTRLIEEIKRNGGDELMAVLRAEQLRSVETIIEVRDDPKARPADRTAAANSILDRYLGKPTQRVETKSEVTHLAGDIDNIERQLNELEREEKRLRGINPDAGVAQPEADDGATVVT